MVCCLKFAPCFFLKVLHNSPGMLYFLDEKPGNGWADGTLRALGYNSNPGKLQAVAGLCRKCAVGTRTTKFPESLTLNFLDGKFLILHAD